MKNLQETEIKLTYTFILQAYPHSNSLIRSMILVKTITIIVNIHNPLEALQNLRLPVVFNGSFIQIQQKRHNLFIAKAHRYELQHRIRHNITYQKYGYMYRL